MSSQGPDVDGLTGLLSATDIPVIASGGVGGVEDLATLAAVRADAGDGRSRGLDGAIVGRALYEGRFTVAQALAAIDGAATGARRN